MPVVPTVSGRQVQSRGVQTGGFQTFDVPQAGQVLANVADQYAVAYGEARQKANVALSQDAILQLNQRSNERLYNPQTGFYAQQGKNAIGKGQEYILNRPGFPGEYFICELRLPDHYFRWKHNKLFLLLPEEYGPAFPAIVDCYTSPPTLVWPVPLLSGFSSSYGVLPPLCKDH